MIIDTALEKLSELTPLAIQWEFAESNGLIEMRDSQGIIWILRDKLIFRDQVEDRSYSHWEI